MRSTCKTLLKFHTFLFISQVKTLIDFRHIVTQLRVQDKIFLPVSRCNKSKKGNHPKIYLTQGFTTLNVTASLQNQCPTITKVLIYNVALIHTNPVHLIDIVVLMCDFWLSTIHSKAEDYLYKFEREGESKMFDRYKEKKS